MDGTRHSCVTPVLPPSDLSPVAPRSSRKRECTPTDDNVRPRRYLVDTLKFGPQVVVLLDAGVERLLLTGFC